MKNATLVRASLILIGVHFILNLVHGWAHEDKSVAVTMGQNLFIFPVILIGPFVAAVFIWKRWSRTGYLLLALTMGGACLFGLVWHFVIDSPDHVGHVHGGVGALVFFWTSVALFLVEAAGALIGGYGFFRSVGMNSVPAPSSSS